MNRVAFFALATLLALGAMISCEKEPIKAIAIKSDQQTTQTVFADDEKGSSTVSFTTTSAWTSSISETRAEGSWVSINPSSGDAAGDYTIAITLEPNYTDVDRSATILITSGGESLPITVTQKAVTETGEKPVDPNTDILTLIPDPVFLAYCQEQMPEWDTDSNGKLSYAEAAAVERIDCRQTEEYTGAKIKSLSGIEYFTGLIYLICAYNELASLDVSKNTDLTLLVCENNSIASLDLSKNSALTLLVCGNNSIASLDLSKNTVLTELDCSQNQLTTLDLSQNTALTLLYCFGNQLSSLDVSKNTGLTELYFNVNQLTSIDVSKNTALTELNFGGNQLTSIDLSKNSALTGLDCSQNQLTSIDVSKNSALTGLDCSQNQLTALDVSKNSALTGLDCSQNQLTALDLSQNSALTWLTCAYNQLSSLDITQNTALTFLECFNNPGDGVSMFPIRAWFDNDAVPQDFTTRSWSSDGILIRPLYYTGQTPPDDDGTPLYESSDYSQDGGVTVIQQATEGAGIDIVLMGDGYSDRQIAAGEYAEAIRLAADNLFTVEPFRSFKQLFNLYAITVVSKNEGYTPSGETALEGYFGEGTIVGGNDGTCFAYAQKAVATSRMDDVLIVVMMNSDAISGTCCIYSPSSPNDWSSGITVSYFPVGSNTIDFAKALHHEANGHGFAKLGDEYAYESRGTVPNSEVTKAQAQQNDYGWWKNIDFTSDLSTIGWHYFISDPRYAAEGLGAYEGGKAYWSGVWRPTYNSIMNDNTGEFNAPSREAIYYRIHKLAYGASWTYNYEEFVAWDLAHRPTRSASRSDGVGEGTVLKPVPHTPPVVLPYSWSEVVTQ